MEALLTILAIYNVTQIISQMYIFKPFREWVGTWSGFLYKLLTCFLCTSVWVSLVATLVVWNLAPEMNFSIVISTMAYSCIVWFMYLVENNLSK